MFGPVAVVVHSVQLQVGIAGIEHSNDSASQSSCVFQRYGTGMSVVGDLLLAVLARDALTITVAPHPPGLRSAARDLLPKENGTHRLAYLRAGQRS